MGSFEWYYVPKVWSPSGGWWAQPKNGPRNTRIFFVAGHVIAGLIFWVSARNERRPHSPVKAGIPSQYWCRHAVEDDPRLVEYFNLKKN